MVKLIFLEKKRMGEIRKEKYIKWERYRMLFKRLKSL